MHRIILACAVAGILAIPAHAQSLRDQLVGAWALASCGNPNGPIAASCGANPNGIPINDASGRYAWIIALRGRPKPSAGRNSPAEELKPLVAGLTAQFGTWSLNEADKTYTIHADGALFRILKGQKTRPLSASPGTN